MLRVPRCWCAASRKNWNTKNWLTFPLCFSLLKILWTLSGDQKRSVEKCLSPTGQCWLKSKRPPLCFTKIFNGPVCNIWTFWRRNSNIKWLLTFQNATSFTLAPPHLPPPSALLSLPVNYGGLHSQTLNLLLHVSVYLKTQAFALNVKCAVRQLICLHQASIETSPG